MNLDNVTAVLRPRSGWEAADLGCALVRRHYPMVMAIWALTVLPLWAVVLFLSRENLVWAGFVIFLLQPLYGRAPLFYISRTLFGDKPGLAEVLRAVPGLWSRGFAYSMTFGRFSPSRSLLLPIILLERPKWKAFKKRSGALKLNGDGSATTTITCWLLMIAFMLALGGLVRMLTANGMSPDWRGVFFDLWIYIGEAIDARELAAPAMWGLLVVYMASITFIEPFYIGAGFGQYLDARTHLEGWDIELQFRKLSDRVARLRAGVVKVLPLMAALLFLSAGASELRAADDLSPEEAIAEIMAHADFEIHKETEKRWVSDGDSNRDYGDFSAMEGIGDLMFWAIVIAAVAGLAYLIWANRHVFAGGGGAGKENEVAKARTVMGMDVDKESLPDDLAAAAWDAFGKGDHALAMGLLYRGAISWLVEREGLPVLEGDTEGDCVVHSTSMSDLSRVACFASLTETWKAFAYGEQPPGEAEVRGYCQSWPFDMRKGAGE